MNLLIAEDDLDMQKILRLYLEREGYQTAIVSNGREAIDFLVNHPVDLVLLDWMMPVQNGIQTLEEIRRLNIPVKVLMLTAKNGNDNEITGLACGADDYLRKPFDLQVLLWRVKKLCRLEQPLCYQDLHLTPSTMEVTKNGRKLTLTKTEYELLKYFLLNQRIVLSREQLLNNVWGINYDGDIRAVDTAVRRLRKKIGPDCIQTRIGLGYIMGIDHDEKK